MDTMFNEGRRNNGENCHIYECNKFPVDNHNKTIYTFKLITCTNIKVLTLN
jgi:hypothetical protein